jgi:hypothetical protein
MRSRLDDGMKLDGREVNEMLPFATDAVGQAQSLSAVSSLGTRSSLLFSPTA